MYKSNLRSHPLNGKLDTTCTIIFICQFSILIKMKCASILNLILVARPFAAASIATRQTLEACAKQVLLGSDAAQRIVKPQDSTYTDARLGEKVQ